MGTPEAVLETLKSCRSILLTGPADPDGDSIGACLALQRWLRHQGLSVEVTGNPGYRYSWMPGASEMIPDAKISGTPDAVVILDGDRNRLSPGAGRAFANARVRAIIDHHGSNTPEGYTHWWFEPHATSTCEMLYDAMAAVNHPIDRDLATVLYVGSIFDTGGFRHSNTTPATHRMAAVCLQAGVDSASVALKVLLERRMAGLRAAGLIYQTSERHCDDRVLIGELSHADSKQFGLVGGDLEGVVESLLCVVGTEVSVLLTEKADGTSKVSMRSRGAVNVAQIAGEISKTGGGHAKAAGASVPEPLESTKAKLIAAIARVL